MIPTAPLTHRDNWGWQARIGMFIVASEAVPEAEWWAMLPPHVSVHAARVTARAPWARWRADRSGVDLEDDLARGAHQFATMRLSAVVIGHSSSSIMGGKGWDEAVTASLTAILGSGVKVTTNGQFGSQVLANNMFQEAFSFNDTGKGAALAILIFLSVLPIMITNIRRMQRES